MASWQGKTALVTGGSRGLGRAIATELLHRGANVAIAARDAERLNRVAAELSTGGRQVLAVPADITRQADVDAMISKTIERFGRLDMLVNNAGRSARGAAMDTTAEEFAELTNLNLVALVRSTRAAMPYLLASRGHLVNIGSLAGKTGARYMGAYSATKFAVSGYSQQLRLELSPQGLHVLLVSPGPIARDEPRDDSKGAGNAKEIGDSKRTNDTNDKDKLAGLPPSARKPGGGVKVGLLKPDKLARRIIDYCERGKPELVVPGRARLVFAIAQLWPSFGDWIVRKMS